MKRMLITAAVVLTLAGCRSTCCNKRSCATCPPAAPLVGPTAVPPTPEILVPNPGVGTVTPPPAPNFPGDPPGTSRFAPAGGASGIANVPSLNPAVILEKPDATTTSLKASPVSGSIQEVVPGRVATGRRPTLAELEQLRRAGYREVVCLDAPGGLPEVDRRVLEGHSFRLVSTTKPAAQLGASGPVYVYANDADLLRAWWRNYFRTVEHLSDDAARVRADRIGR
jgi:hypothetical protein